MGNSISWNADTVPVAVNRGPGKRLAMTPSASTCGLALFRSLPPLLLVQRIAAISGGRQHIATLCKGLAAHLDGAPPTKLRPHGPMTQAQFDAAFRSAIARSASDLIVLDLSDVGHLLTPAHLPLLSSAALPKLASFTLRRCELDPRLLPSGLPLSPALTNLTLLCDSTPVYPACLTLICSSAPSLVSLSITLNAGRHVDVYPKYHPALAALSSLTCLTRLHVSCNKVGCNRVGCSKVRCLGKKGSKLLLAATASLPALQSLVFDSLSVPLADATYEQLAGHTALKELALLLDNPKRRVSIDPLLTCLASRLQHLQRLRLVREGPPGAALTVSTGALARLTALESLRLDGILES